MKSTDMYRCVDSRIVWYSMAYHVYREEFQCLLRACEVLPKKDGGAVDLLLRVDVWGR